MRWVNILLCILLISVYAVVQADASQVAIRTVTLNISPDSLPLSDQQQIIQDIQSRTYTRTKADGVLKEITQRVIYAFQVRGFFKARVSQSAMTAVSETPQKEIVDIALSVSEGEQYRLRDISFTGEKAFSDRELRAEFPIAGGDIFNTETIRQALDALRKLYESKGYVNFTPVPNTQTDDAAHTISLMVDLDEGVQFRIGLLILDGVETKPGAGAKLLENWKQYEGQIYDPAIPEKFLRENAALLPPGVSWNNLAITQDPHRHILNFRLDLPDLGDVNR